MGLFQAFRPQKHKSVKTLVKFEDILLNVNRIKEDDKLNDFDVEKARYLVLEAERLALTINANQVNTLLDNIKKNAKYGHRFIRTFHSEINEAGLEYIKSLGYSVSEEVYQRQHFIKISW